MATRLRQCNDDMRHYNDEQCDASISRWLYFKSLNPNCKEEELLKAIEDGKCRRAELLHKAGASPDLREENAATALFVAREMGYSDCVSLLLETGAGPDGQILQHLIRNGANPNTPLPNGYTALHEACRIGHLPLIRFLLRNGANVEATVKCYNDSGTSGNTPLMLALFWGQIGAADLLLKRGARLEARGYNNRTALLAVSRSSLASVRFALDCGANIEARDSLGFTALMIAASCGRADIVQFLLERGADVDARDNQGRTALHVTAEFPSEGQIEALDTLLNNSADVEARDMKGRTPLIAAAGAWEPLVAETLLARSANVEATDLRGLTALLVASEARRGPGIALNRLLITAGANIHAMDVHGRTALDRARIARNMVVTDLLREAGAK